MTDIQVTELAADWRGLSKELKPYLRPSEFGVDGLMLSHPLIVTPVPYPQINALFEQKQRSVREAVERGDWDDALVWYEKQYRIDALYELRGRISVGEMRGLLPGTWRMVEFPHQNAPHVVRELFRITGFLVDSDAAERRGTDLPDEVLTVYRGTVPKGKRGWSWTTDREKAEWFAHRWQGARRDGVVYAMDVEPQHVLAIFDNRGESEVVVARRATAKAHIAQEPQP